MSPAASVQLPLTRPLRGVRVHAVPAGGSAAVSEPAARLLDLRRRAEQEAERRAAQQRVLAALDEATRALPGVVGGRLDEIAALVGELALAVAGEVIGAALDKGLVDPVPIVARCLRQVAGGSAAAPLQVYLAPDDHALLLSSISEDPDLAQRATAATFAPDRTLGRGVVRVESGAGRLLYDPAEVFARIAAEIRKGCAP